MHGALVYGRQFCGKCSDEKGHRLTYALCYGVWKAVRCMHHDKGGYVRWKRKQEEWLRNVALGVVSEYLQETGDIDSQMATVTAKRAEVRCNQA